MPSTNDGVPRDPYEGDRLWLEQVYQGDHIPQLTVRAVVTGGLIGMFLAIGNIWMVMKVGWAFGVAITACTVSYIAWGGLRALSGKRLSQISILENNCMQSTASSAGYATGSSLAVVFAALLILDPQHHHQPWWVVALFLAATGAMGVFLAIPIKRQYINREKLPFPSGTATAATLRGLYEHGAGAARKAYALVGAMAGAALLGLLNTAQEQFAALGRFFEWMRLHLVDVHIPDQVPATGFLPMDGKPVVGFHFEPGTALVGAGMLISPRVGLSALFASGMLYLVVAPWLHGIDVLGAATPGFVASIPTAGGGAVFHPVRWSLWGGVSVLVFSSLANLALQWRSIGRAFLSLKGRVAGASLEGTDALAAIEVPLPWFVLGLIPITAAMMFLQVVAFGIAWWLGLIAIFMSFAISIVVARTAGESDISALGPLGKVMQLLFAVLSPPSAVGLQASLNHNVLSAGISATSANCGVELLSDLKSGYLLGANPRRQFIAQCWGIVFGVVACVPAWYLLVPTVESLDNYPMPATQVWVAVARALTSGLGSLPASVQYAVLIGAAIGFALPLLEHQFPKLHVILPSATGLGLGWVVFFANALSLAIGVALAMLWRRLWPVSMAAYATPVASGLIAGESIVKALLAMLATALGLLA